MRALVTGAAGFIGRAAVEELLASGWEVVGIDNLNSYYDPAFKRARIASLAGFAGFDFKALDICDRSGMQGLFSRHRFDAVLHLAAQVGVRHGAGEPADYLRDNLVGFGDLLEHCRKAKVGHLAYASSSSVYGSVLAGAFKESDPTDSPLSLYAATKKANESMAHACASQWGLPCTGLRFFTVYGPWGRPDMALSIFAKALEQGQPLRLHNGGEMSRDFTYVGDVAKALRLVLEKPASPQEGSSVAWRVFNVGSGSCQPLLSYLEALESSMGIKGHRVSVPMEASEALSTWSDCSALRDWVGFAPLTRIQDGVEIFARWRERWAAGEFDV